MSGTFKVLICDGMAAEGLAVFEKYQNFEVDLNKGISRDDVLAKIVDADAVVVRSATRIDQEMISVGKNLKVIARAGVGLDNVDLPAATQRGIVVMNTPSGNTISAAEQAFALMLAVLRNLPQADARMREGGWDRNKFTGHEAYGKTLGLIGLGRIGREVAKRAQSFEMRTIGCDPFLSKEIADAEGIELVDLETVLAESDIVSLHTPINDDTRGMINKDSIAKMKKGAFLVNAARGPLIVDEDLAEALKAGHLAGAALDVFHKEPPENCPLIGLPNVITTPHLGASTEEAQINVAVQIAEQIIDALEDREVRNAANMPRVDPEVRRILGPYIQLGDRLGQFAAQLLEGKSLQKIEVHYMGELTQRDCAPITTGVLRGVFSDLMLESVNYVNAPVLAKDQGVKIETATSTDDSGFTNLIKVVLRSGDQTISVAGTIFEGQQLPRIVEINNYQLEAIPEGSMLVIRNKDIPGVVGLVGSEMAKQNINIAAMALGTNPEQPDAMAIINVNQPVPAEALNALKQSENILNARAIHIS